MTDRKMTYKSMTRRDRRFMAFLENEAMNMERQHKARLAALVVIKNQVISIGYNQEKTDPFAADYQRHKDAIYLHAETHAIKKALRVLRNPQELANATLYVCRMKCDSNDHQKMIRGMARPCKGCQKAILEYGIRRVVYSLDETRDCGEWP